MIPPASGSGSPRPLFARSPLPLPTGSESAAFDREAIENRGVPSPVLMENAGRSAALVLDSLSPRTPICVLAGPGHNGGDGIVLARTLHLAGRDVRVVVVGDRQDPDPLLHGHSPALIRIDAESLVEDWEAVEVALAECPVLVDALLGTGVRGAPRPPFGRILAELGARRTRGARIVALDLPSGVDADTGAAPGGLPGADLTLTFGAPKLGCLLHPGRAMSGRIVALEIGFPPWPEGAAGAELITPEWAGTRAPRRALRSHKKGEGRLLLLGGAPGMGGAIIMAARAALRAGAGYVRVASHPDQVRLLHATVPEAVVVDASDTDAFMEALSDSDALAAGPGMGRGTLAASLERALESLPSSVRILLDADALTLLASGDLPRWAERIPDGGSGARLLTPHPGEASALLGIEASAIVADPLRHARECAQRWGATVLLKGTPSVVAHGRPGRVRVSLSGSSEFARAGMGDVLTGVSGALLARGLGAPDAAALALHWTGRAADHLAMGPALLPGDVTDALPAAMGETGPGSTDLSLPFVLLDLPPAH